MNNSKPIAVNGYVASLYELAEAIATTMTNNELSVTLLTGPLHTDMVELATMVNELLESGRDPDFSQVVFGIKLAAYNKNLVVPKVDIKYDPDQAPLEWPTPPRGKYLPFKLSIFHSDADSEDSETYEIEDIESELGKMFFAIAIHKNPDFFEPLPQSSHYLINRYHIEDLIEDDWTAETDEYKTFGGLSEAELEFLFPPAGTK